MSTTTTPTSRGTVFRVARLAAGASVRAVAARAGITPSTLSRWERGEREIAEDTYDALTQALADLMNGAAA